MTAALFDVGLCALMLAAALSAVGGRNLFGGVVFFIVYGLLVAIAWVRLEAIDVALAEAAIGAGLTGLLLVGTWAQLRRPAGGGDDPDDVAAPLMGRIATGLAAALLFAGLAAAILTLPAGEGGLAAAVAAHREAAGLGNPVTAVLLDFRAYDTLLESVVLLVALVAAWAVVPAELWGAAPGLRHRPHPGGVLATIGRLLPPLGLMVAIYLVWAGSDRPGGAFQAGTVLAAVWLLAAMAGVARAPAVTNPGLRATLVAGPAIFLAIGTAGALGGVFLDYPEGWAKPLIVTIEYALAASIAATLALLVAGAPRSRT